MTTGKGPHQGLWKVREQHMRPAGGKAEANKPAAAAQLNHMLPLRQMAAQCLCMSHKFTKSWAASAFHPSWCTPAIPLAGGGPNIVVMYARKAILGSLAPAT